MAHPERHTGLGAGSHSSSAEAADNADIAPDHTVQSGTGVEASLEPQRRARFSAGREGLGWPWKPLEQRHGVWVTPFLRSSFANLPRGQGQREAPSSVWLPGAQDPWWPMGEFSSCAWGTSPSVTGAQSAPTRICRNCALLAPRGDCVLSLAFLDD